MRVSSSIEKLVPPLKVSRIGIGKHLLNDTFVISQRVRRITAICKGPVLHVWRGTELPL